MDLLIKAVKGYACFDAVIEIYAPDGRFLYYRENPEQKRVVFNLPVGEWITDNELTELKRPLKYRTPKLPKPDKQIPVVDLTYIIQTNKNKLSIDVRSGLVIIDPDMWEIDVPFLTFVLFHEIGHFYYNGGEHEHYADIFAAKNMLRRGFNLSQINYAQEFCLSEGKKSVDRKDYLYNWLKRVTFYE